MLKKSVWIFVVSLSVITTPRLKADGVSFGVSCYACRRINVFSYKRIEDRDLFKNGSAGNNASVNLYCGYRFGEPYNEKFELQSFLGFSLGKQEILWSKSQFSIYSSQFISDPKTSVFRNIGIDFGINTKVRFYEFGGDFWATARIGVIGSYLVSLNQYVEERDVKCPNIGLYNKSSSQKPIEVKIANPLKRSKRLNIGITAGIGLEIDYIYMGVHAGFWFMDHLRNKKHMYSQMISYGKNQFDIGVCIEINFMKSISNINSEQDEES